MFPATVAVERLLRYEVTVGTNEEFSRAHRNTVNEAHPESHARIERILETLKGEGLLDRMQIIQKWVKIDDSELRMTHERKHVDEVRSIAKLTQQAVNEWAAKFDSVFATPASVAAAESAVACNRQLAEWIVAGKIPCSLSLTRPPGHHADTVTPCGFCLFNNVAQAVDAAVVEGASRILVVDLDVHHGQGTQRIFYENENVLYCSIHRYEYGRYWPNLKESSAMEVGGGAGRGLTVNVPLQETGCGDADYLFILLTVLLPIARDFHPDLVIVSAGFDSCRGDPLGGMEVTPTGYAHLIHHLKALAEGRMLVTLEGGYNHVMSAEAATACTRVLLGEQPERIDQLQRVKQSTRVSVMNTISAQLPYWSCLQQYATNHFKQNFPTSCALRFEPPEKDCPTGNVLQEQLLKPEKRNHARHRVFRTKVIHVGRIHEGHEHPQNNSFEMKARIQRCVARLDALKVNVEEVKEDDEKRTLYWIERTHNKDYLEKMEKSAQMGADELAELSLECGGSFVTNDTWRAAISAAETTIQAVDAVLSSSSPFTSAFALVRPPGHHAGRSDSGGFCFLNNVAIAANYALSLLPPSARVLIVDFDVHLGDGTLDCLSGENFSRCRYVSVHRSEENTFYPQYPEETDVQEEGGLNHVLLPLSGAQMGDAEYLAIIDRMILPMAYSLAPEAILISVGFDCLKGDPLGGYAVSASTLALLVSHLQAVAPVIAVLEGGYDLDSLPAGVEAVVRVMDGNAVKGVERRGRICPEAVHALRMSTDRYHSVYDLIQN